MMLQEGASPQCDVITPVTRIELERYEKNCSKYQWLYNHNVEKPVEVIQSPFGIAMSEQWSGLAHMMLEISKLPFLYAFKVW